MSVEFGIQPERSSREFPGFKMDDAPDYAGWSEYKNCLIEIMSAVDQQPQEKGQ